MSDRKLKLIFLDIDGVLNNSEDNTSFSSYMPEKYGISEKNLENFLSILERVKDVKIVLSTSWRKYPYDYEYRYKDKLFKSPLKGLIDRIGKNRFYEIDRIPHLNRKTKYLDIMGFFYILKERKHIDMADVSFVILDDLRNQDLDLFEHNFFCTNVKTGLTASDAENIFFFLTQEISYA